MSRVACVVLLAVIGSAARSHATAADSILALHPLRTAADSLHVAAVLDSLGVERAAGGTEAAFAEAESLVARGLEQRSGRNVQMELRVDPSIIGGVVARIGSTVYDASVATQLLKLKQRLVENV